MKEEAHKYQKERGKMGDETTGSRAMNGGDGRYSYKRNSDLQRATVERTKFWIQEAISNNLDMIKATSSTNTFKIADLGCSVGPNTIISVANIIDAVKLLEKRSNDKKHLEFQVFFNDHVSNDFNTLFKSLPSEKQYFAAGVPGPYQNRLFPESSINFFNSSASLHWLLATPKALTDKNSPAYNKGRIYYNDKNNAVSKTYSAHYANEIESFLRARADELVSDGMMVINILCLPDGLCPSKCSFFLTTDGLESCLLEMAKSGIVSEDKIDSFNLPMYFPTPQELASLIKKNGCFNIEVLETYLMPNVSTVLEAEQWVSHMRAGFEGFFKEHFGNDVTDKLFDMFAKKYVDPSVFTPSPHLENMVGCLLIMKRNST